MHVVYSPALFYLHFKKLKLKTDTQGDLRHSRPHHFHYRGINVYMDLWTGNCSRCHLWQWCRDRKIILSYSKYHCSNPSTVGDELISKSSGVWVPARLAWGMKWRTVICSRRIWDASCLEIYRASFRMEHWPSQKPQLLRAENSARLSGFLFSQPFHHVNLKQLKDNNLLLSSLPTATVLKTFCICSVDVSDNIDSLLQHIICVQWEFTVF